jgi:hypothetical protein
MVYGWGQGKEINRELIQWFYKLRTLPTTNWIKHIDGGMRRWRK